MSSSDQAYFVIAVFEIGRADGGGKFYREDFYLVCAADVASAEGKAKKMAQSLEYEAGTGEDRSYVRWLHLVDVAPTLVDLARDAVDLYSRHFASLETYSDFEMKLGGRDPLAF